jgi:hypothetical protein
MKVWVQQAATSGVVFGAGELPPLTLDTVGDYVGDEPYQHDGNPWVPKGRRNPKIVLEGGGVVWGCECWWGPVQPETGDGR